MARGWDPGDVRQRHVLSATGTLGAWLLLGAGVVISPRSLAAAGWGLWLVAVFAAAADRRGNRGFAPGPVSVGSVVLFAGNGWFRFGHRPLSEVMLMPLPAATVLPELVWSPFATSALADTFRDSPIHRSAPGCRRCAWNPHRLPQSARLPCWAYGGRSWSLYPHIDDPLDGVRSG